LRSRPPDTRIASPVADAPVALATSAHPFAVSTKAEPTSEPSGGRIPGPATERTFSPGRTIVAKSSRSRASSDWRAASRWSGASPPMVSASSARWSTVPFKSCSHARIMRSTARRLSRKLSSALRSILFPIHELASGAVMATTTNSTTKRGRMILLAIRRSRKKSDSFRILVVPTSCRRHPSHVLGRAPRAGSPECAIADLPRFRQRAHIPPVVFRQLKSFSLAKGDARLWGLSSRAPRAPSRCVTRQSHLAARRSLG